MGRVIVTFRTATGRPARSGALAILVERATTTVSTWRKRWRQRRRMDALSDHMLKDMGLTRFDPHSWRG